MTLVPVDLNEPPAYHPCDWVGTAEAAGILGAPFGSTEWQFYVLLPGERIYVVSGRQSCDTLNQIAREAIPRGGG
jgi:hypothetical protein